MMTKVLSIEIPEYTVDKKPGYMVIGPKVDKLIGENLEDSQYVIRAISLADHPGKTLDELAAIILQLGTDKYDPDRKEDEWKAYAGYDHDFQASTMEVKRGKTYGTEEDDYPSMFGDFIYNFYENMPIARNVVLRIDILMIYYSSKVQLAERVDPSKPDISPYDKYLYKFKDPSRKQDALAALVKIL